MLRPNFSPRIVLIRHYTLDGQRNIGCGLSYKYEPENRHDDGIVSYYASVCLGEAPFAEHHQLLYRIAIVEKSSRPFAHRSLTFYFLVRSVSLTAVEPRAKVYTFALQTGQLPDTAFL